MTTFRCVICGNEWQDEVVSGRVVYYQCHRCGNLVAGRAQSQLAMYG